MANITREKFTANMQNAYNRKLSAVEVKEGFAPLPDSLDYDVEYDKILDIASVRELNKFPKEDEIVDFVNAREKANARQKAMQKKLDDLGAIRPTLENDDQLKLKQTFGVLMSQKNADGSKKYNEAEAKAAASNFLGLTWAE